MNISAGPSCVGGSGGAPSGSAREERAVKTTGDGAVGGGDGSS